jgi:hypothetical protein
LDHKAKVVPPYIRSRRRRPTRSMN